MTAPALASTSRQGHRVYAWQGRDYPSVTAVIRGGVPAPFLPAWAAKAAAEYAVANLDRLALLPAGQAVREVKRAPWAARDAAADLGTAVHAAMEAEAIGRPRPELPAEAGPLLAAFEEFTADHRPRWRASEATVFSRRYGYAGTLDAVCELPRLGQTVVLDLKTGRGVYPEAALHFADDLPRRLRKQATGKGARLVAVALAAGCSLELVWVRPGSRDDERRWKNQKAAPRLLCPVCPSRGPRREFGIPGDAAAAVQGVLTLAGGAQ